MTHYLRRAGPVSEGCSNYRIIQHFMRKQPSNYTDYFSSKKKKGGSLALLPLSTLGNRNLPMQSLSIADFAPSGKIGAWTRFGVSDWPQPHPKDVHDFKRLRVYVYDLPNIYVAGVAQYLSVLLAPKQLELQHLQRRREQAVARAPAAGISHCMLRRCVLRNVLNSSRAAAFGRLGLRQYTSEIPVLLRLLQVATLVARPEDAHAFLVPMPIGTWITSGFIRQRPGSLRGLLGTTENIRFVTCSPRRRRPVAAL